MRLIAPFYAVIALFMAVTRDNHSDPVPWVAVCLTAAMLAGAATLKRPLVLLSAAHAGLTATWAGTLTARMMKGQDPLGYVSLGMLLFLCAGMAVIVAIGLKSSPRAREQTSPPQ